jgi:hypothetical protein
MKNMRTQQQKTNETNPAAELRESAIVMHTLAQILAEFAMIAWRALPADLRTSPTPPVMGARR